MTAPALLTEFERRALSEEPNAALFHEHLNTIRIHNSEMRILLSGLGLDEKATMLDVLARVNKLRAAVKMALSAVDESTKLHKALTQLSNG